jgi:hypothetical protein
MVTAYSPILKLALPVQGELSGTWGDVVNDNITSMVEQAIAGRAVIDTWTTNSHVLTTANGTTSESRCAMLEFTDTGTALSGAGTVTCPTLSKIYIAKNASGQNVTLKTSGGTGILVPNGRTMFLFCDGTNVVEAVTSTTSLQLGTSTIVTAVLDEDDMASDSATSLATQQSIKAYVDSQVGANNELSEVLANGNTTGATDIAVDSAQKVQFRDAAIYINSSVDGQLDIVADTEIQIAATTIDINGALDVSGTALVTGVLTTSRLRLYQMAVGNLTARINVGVDDTGYDVKFFGATTGKSLLWDESADSLIVTGTTTLVGTTNLDAVDIDGATQIDATVTVGVDDTGYDVKFFGATTGKSLLWDESADSLIITGSTSLQGGLEVGVDDAGYDVKFFGATAGAYMLWDESADTLEVSGTVTADGLTVDASSAVVQSATGTASPTATTFNISTTSSGSDWATTSPWGRLAFYSGDGSGGGGKPHVVLDATATNAIGASSTFSISTTSESTNTLTKRLNIANGGDISFYAADGTTPSFVYDESAGLTINEAGADRDFLVKSDTNANALFVEGSSGNVGMNGATSPTSPLCVGGNSTQTLKPTVNILDTSAGASLSLRGGSPRIFMDATAGGVPKILMDSQGIEFKDGTLDSEGSVAVKIDSSGNVGIGASSPVTLKSATTLQVSGNAKLGDDNGRGLLSLGDIASTGANAGIWRGAAGAYAGTGNYLNLGGYDGITFTTGAADISAQTERMRIDSSGGLITNPAAGGHAVFNEGGVDADFRVESATTANALFVEGSSGNVGIGESDPASPLDIHVATDINMEVDSNASVLRISAVNDARSTNPAMSFQALSYDFRGAGGIGTRAVIDSSGGLITTPAAGGHAVFNEGGVDADFRVASDGNVNMLFVDGGANHVNIGTATNLGSTFNVSGSTAMNGGASGATTASGATLSIQGTGTYNSDYFGSSLATVAIRSNKPANNLFNPTLHLTTIRQSLGTNQNSTGGIGFTTVDDSNSTGIDDAARIQVINLAPSSTTSSTGLVFYNNVGGSKTQAAQAVFKLAPTEAVFNEDSADIDFRVESDGNGNMLFVDAEYNAVGIGNAAPRAPLDIRSTIGAHALVAGFIRVTSNDAVDILTVSGQPTNAGVAIYARLVAASAVSDDAAVIEFWAALNRQSSGADTATAVAPVVSKAIVGTAIGAGSLAWSGKILQYTPACTTNYVGYQMEIQVVTNDATTITINAVI